MLFEAVTRQWEAKGVMARTGTLVDATLIPSASIRHDGEGRWAGHRRRKPLHGDKAHIATDEDAGLVRGVEVTTANVHDAAGSERVLPPEPGDVYADSAFTGCPAERLILGRGGRRCTAWTGIWARAPEALTRLEAHNAAVRRVRYRIEKVFGTCKRSYGPRRMRWPAWPGRDCRSASLPWPTTCGAPSPCARPPLRSDAGGVCPKWPKTPQRTPSHPEPALPAPRQPGNSADPPQ